MIVHTHTHSSMCDKFNKLLLKLIFLSIIVIFSYINGCL